uniref:Capsid protein n=1 Tax=Periparus ater Genomoviridae sp. TaxID=2814985 RepID=A0A8E7G212_9VIRU|nr:MAG: capsid protein [Gemycircularvirus]
MPRYARKRRSYSTSRRRTTTKRSKVSPRLRSYGRKKYGGKTTKKRILNVTSTKKRNTMLSWSNTTSSGASATIAVGSAFVNAPTSGLFVFCPTAQSFNSDSLARNQASRSATTCYMVGFSEHIRIQTSSGLPWFHRRICFTTRGTTFFNNASASDTPTQSTAPYVSTSNGYERLWLNGFVNAQGQTISGQYGLLFRGVQGQDWNDPITAFVDRTRVDVKFDKTYKISSGNSNGVVRERKLFHSMRHNLVYDDDEAGSGESTSVYSVDNKQGMGDYFVVDIIQAGIGGTSSDLLSINATSTLYWHEK